MRQVSCATSTTDARDNRKSNKKKTINLKNWQWNVFCFVSFVFFFGCLKTPLIDRYNTPKKINKRKRNCFFAQSDLLWHTYNNITNKLTVQQYGICVLQERVGVGRLNDKMSGLLLKIYKKARILGDLSLSLSILRSQCSLKEIRPCWVSKFKCLCDDNAVPALVTAFMVTNNKLFSVLWVAKEEDSALFNFLVGWL